MIYLVIALIATPAHFQKYINTSKISIKIRTNIAPHSALIFQNEIKKEWSPKKNNFKTLIY